MTQALCLRCGEIKFGALTDCPACDRPPHSNVAVNLLFSTHCMYYATLKAMSQVVKKLREAGADEDTTAGSLLRYVSLRKPKLLLIEVSDETLARWDALLRRAAVPEVLFH